VLRQVGDVVLIIIDPISAYMGGVDSHKNSDVRALLTPVAELAARYGAAIVVISHLNKGGAAGAIGRITGSIGLPAAARAAYLIQKDADDASRRLFLHMKNNIGTDHAGLAFRIVERQVTGSIRAPVIEWENQHLTITADEALAASANEGEERGAVGEAMDFLQDILCTGPVSCKHINAGAKANGIKDRTLDRAKKRLGILTRKTGMKDGWIWELPPEERQPDAELAPFEERQDNPKSASPKDVAPFGDFGALRAKCHASSVQPESAIEAQSTPKTGAIEIAAPAPYASRLSEVQQACPDGVPRERWRLCLEDARIFFARWGQQAQKLGWSGQDLLGLHPEKPMERDDQKGLIWLLRGQTVTDFDARSAKLSGGLTFRRRS
jgi:hypothetical protein